MPFVNRLNQLRERRSSQALAAFDDTASRLADSLAVSALDRYQARYRPAVPRDDHALATSDAIQQARQMGLGFVGTHSFHTQMTSGK